MKKLYIQVTQTNYQLFRVMHVTCMRPRCYETPFPTGVIFRLRPFNKTRKIVEHCDWPPSLVAIGCGGEKSECGCERIIRQSTCWCREGSFLRTFRFRDFVCVTARGAREGKGSVAHCAQRAYLISSLLID